MAILCKRCRGKISIDFFELSKGFNPKDIKKTSTESLSKLLCKDCYDKKVV